MCRFPGEPSRRKATSDKAGAGASHEMASVWSRGRPLSNSGMCSAAPTAWRKRVGHAGRGRRCASTRRSRAPRVVGSWAARWPSWRTALHPGGQVAFDMLEPLDARNSHGLTRVGVVGGSLGVGLVVVNAALEGHDVVPVRPRGGPKAPDAGLERWLPGQARRVAGASAAPHMGFPSSSDDSDSDVAELAGADKLAKSPSRQRRGLLVRGHRPRRGPGPWRAARQGEFKNRTDISGDGSALELDQRLGAGGYGPLKAVLRLEDISGLEAGF